MTSTSSTDVPSAISADALIIGFGKGGKTLAAKLASTGRTVVVAEASADMYGGTCINIGCLPSKSLILSADRARREGANRTAETREAAFEAAIREKRRVTAMLRDRNYHKLADQGNITVITGRARFTGAHSAEITTADGPVAVAADMMFINTGATPHIPDIPGIRTTPGVYTSTGLMDVDELPQRLVIIGAGFIGLEFASMFADFGTAVTVLQHSDEFLPREDEDVAAAIRAQLESQGVRFLFGADTKAITSADDGIRLSVSMRGTSDVGSEARLCLSTDAVLVGVGRVPNTQGLGLANAGIETDPRGFILVDDHLRVQGKNHIWAMGDVAGSPIFTYISLDDYRIVREQLFGDGKRNRADRTPFPTATFTEPPLAHIGLTETAAQQSGREVKVLKLKADAIPKAKILNQTDGLLKAVVDAHSGEILGVTLFCAEAHEIINLFKMAIDFRVPARYVKNQIFTHPTIAEGLNDLFAGC